MIADPTGSGCFWNPRDHLIHAGNVRSVKPAQSHQCPVRCRASAGTPGPQIVTVGSQCVWWALCNDPVLSPASSAQPPSPSPCRGSSRGGGETGSCKAQHRVCWGTGGPSAGVQRGVNSLPLPSKINKAVSTLNRVFPWRQSPSSRQSGANFCALRGC